MHYLTLPISGQAVPLFPPPHPVESYTYEQVSVCKKMNVNISLMPPPVTMCLASQQYQHLRHFT